MAAAVRMNPDWQTVGIEVRSVALANQRGWTRGHVRYGWGAPDHVERFRVYSETTHRHDYVVTYSIRHDAVCRCTCKAGEYGMPCKHRGAARMWIEFRKAQWLFYSDERDAGVAPYEAHELMSA